MEMQQRRWLEDHSATSQTRWVHEKGAETGDKAIGSAQVGSSLPTAIQDEDLMPSERRFRDDSTKATRFHKRDDGDDRMNENDEDVVHDGLGSNLKKSQNSGRFCDSPPTGVTCSERSVDGASTDIRLPRQGGEPALSPAAINAFPLSYGREGLPFRAPGEN